MGHLHAVVRPQAQVRPTRLRRGGDRERVSGRAGRDGYRHDRVATRDSGEEHRADRPDHPERHRGHDDLDAVVRSEGLALRGKTLGQDAVDHGVRGEQGTSSVQVAVRAHLPEKAEDGPHDGRRGGRHHGHQDTAQAATSRPAPEPSGAHHGDRARRRKSGQGAGPGEREDRQARQSAEGARRDGRGGDDGATATRGHDGDGSRREDDSNSGPGAVNKFNRGRGTTGDSARGSQRTRGGGSDQEEPPDGERSR